ncbi:MAG: hypothetical protein RLZ87_980 [Armatimonadota bacterium]|jgi:hypothetical protein|nr:DUF4446 family protein [Fimbriimonadaceae bacterium]
MTTIITSLRDNSGTILAGLSLLVILMMALLIRATITVNKLHKRFAVLLSDESESSMEIMLREHLEERRNLQKQVESIDHRTAILERKMQRSKRHVGLVRYDAFQDIGGLQSFAMAIYDDNGDGAVVSSIVGRADNKVYGKNIVGGKSDRNLGVEEQQAILEAVKQNQASSVK